jgi:hypothetical protein
MAEMSSTQRAAPAARTYHPFLVALVAWVMPGAGHLLLDRRRRGAAFFLLVLVSILVGCSLQGKLYWLSAGQPLSYLATLGSMGMGAAYFVLLLFGYQGDVVAPGYEYGTTFLLTAGLMNLLLVLDAWDIARGVKD